MGFNEQSFRKAAKEAGFNEAEINAEVEAQKKALPPENSATGKPFGEQSDAEMQKAKQKIEAAGGVVAVPSEKAQAKAKEQSFGEKFLNFIDPTQNPLAGPTEAILGYKAAEMAVNKAKEFVGGLKDRSINKSPMAKGGDVVDVQAKEVAPIPKGWEDIIAKSEQNAASKAADAASKANPIPQNYTAGVPSGQPNAPVNPAGAFTQPSGYRQAPAAPQVPVSQFDLNRLGQPFNVTNLDQSQDPLAGRGFQQPPQSIGPVAPTPSVQESVQTGNPTKAVQAVMAKDIDKVAGNTSAVPAWVKNAEGGIQYPQGMSPAAQAGHMAFNEKYPDIAKTLEQEGKFGILNAGSGDNSIHNSYGSDLMKRIRNEITSGQMIGPHGGEGGVYNTVINPAIQAIPPETALGKELSDLRATQTGGTHGELGTPASIGGKKGGLLTGANTVTKAIKAGGPAMLLMSIADAAKAAQQGKYGEAAFRGLDIATDTIPVVAQMKQGLSPFAVQSPGVSSQTFENAYKLGSPYAQSEEAKKARLKEKAGAGRGIAPPSAYMR